jgi:hypothetical protein
MRRTTRRLRALVLLLGFLVGAYGLPGFDALRYHGVGEVRPPQPHYDPEGGCSAHAETCVLYSTPLWNPLDAARPFELVTVRVERRLPPTPPRQTPRAATFVPTPPSRGPPTVV